MAITWPEGCGSGGGGVPPVPGQASVAPWALSLSPCRVRPPAGLSSRPRPPPALPSLPSAVPRPEFRWHLSCVLVTAPLPCVLVYSFAVILVGVGVACGAPSAMFFSKSLTLGLRGDKSVSPVGVSRDSGLCGGGAAGVRVRAGLWPRLLPVLADTARGAPDGPASRRLLASGLSPAPWFLFRAGASHRDF